MSSKCILLYSTIFAALTSVALPVFATTCVGQTRFLEIASGTTYGPPIQRIVRARVKAHDSRLGAASITVEVTEVIRGEYNHTELTLIGYSNGRSLANNITALQYRVNSEHFFLLSNDDKVQPLIIADACRESSVEIRGNTIVGGQRDLFSRNGYTLELQDFLNELSGQAPGNP